MSIVSHGRHSEHPTGWRRYLYSTNHKDIGTMYLVSALGAGLLGAAFSIVIRAELQNPGLQIVHDSHTYDVLVTGHGLIMIFFVLMPALIGGFGTGSCH
jgi:cytochrome c oxidase subunit I